MRHPFPARWLSHDPCRIPFLQRGMLNISLDFPSSWIIKSDTQRCVFIHCKINVSRVKRSSVLLFCGDNIQTAVWTAHPKPAAATLSVCRQAPEAAAHRTLEICRPGWGLVQNVIIGIPKFWSPFFCCFFRLSKVLTSPASFP